MAFSSRIAAARAVTQPPERARTAMLRSMFRKMEYGYAVLALLVLSSAVVPLIHGAGLTAASSDGDPITRALLAPIYLVAAAMLLLHARGSTRAAARHPWSLALPALAVLSFLWSDLPQLTLRRGGALVGTTLVGVYLATRFDLAVLVRLLAGTLGVAALLSLALSLGWPSLGLTSAGAYAGAWRGVFENKNVLGRAMTLAVMAFVLLQTDPSVRRWVALAGAGLAGLLVWLSASKTALVATIVLLLLLRFFRTLRRSAGAATVAAIVFLLLTGVPAVWIASEADTVLGAMGRDATLTGRTVLWTFVIESIRQRPWLGYGFSAFWTSSNDASRAIIDAIHWQSPHAHNGFLDLTLQLGAIGLAVFLVGYVIAVLRAIKAIRSAEGVCALWPIVFLTFLFLYNMTESTIVRQGSIFWVLYVATACSSLGRSSATGLPDGVATHAAKPGNHASRVARWPKPRLGIGSQLSLGIRQRIRDRISGRERRDSGGA
jgi:exopolysaccharide production protein ExoQ